MANDHDDRNNFETDDRDSRGRASLVGIALGVGAALVVVLAFAGFIAVRHIQAERAVRAERLAEDQRVAAVAEERVAREAEFPRGEVPAHRRLADHAAEIRVTANQLEADAKAIQGDWRCMSLIHAGERSAVTTTRNMTLNL